MALGTDEVARLAISLLDLTDLGDDTTLMRPRRSASGRDAGVAAVCVAGLRAACVKALTGTDIRSPRSSTSRVARNPRTT